MVSPTMQMRASLSCPLMMLFLGAMMIQSSFGTAAPQVMTTYGRITGSRETSRQGKAYNAFRSIPYAKPPVGKRRFTIPEPMPRWSGDLDVSREPPECLQVNYFQIMPPPGVYLNVTGSEDCLYLSVFTPSEKSSRLRAVLVYIHGGGYTSWNGAKFHGPQYFMDEDLVMVYINYRLGPLGFMTFDSSHLPGNLGLRDQNLALKWIKTNIQKFGGDPNRITLMGESAGAAAVHIHMKAKSSRDLFHRGILSSGSMWSQWAMVSSEKAVERAQIVADKLGCSGSSRESTVVRCLRKANADQLLQTFNLFMEWGTNPAVVFGPVGETSRKCFLCSRDVDRQTGGDLMAGAAILEGVGKCAFLYLSSESMNQLNVEWNKWAPVTLYSMEQGSIPNAFNSLRRFYFGDNHINSSSTNLTNLYSDAYINAGLYKTFDHHNGKKFQFLLERNPTTTFIEALGLPHPPGVMQGAGHADDLQYLFNTSHLLPNTALSKEDTDISKKMVHLWANFVKYGDPKSTPTWEPVNTGGQWMSIKMDGQFVMERDQGLTERMNFWKAIDKQIEQETNRNNKHC